MFACFLCRFEPLDWVVASVVPLGCACTNFLQCTKGPAKRISLPSFRNRGLELVNSSQERMDRAKVRHALPGRRICQTRGLEPTRQRGCVDDGAMAREVRRRQLCANADSKRANPKPRTGACDFRGLAGTSKTPISGPGRAWPGSASASKWRRPMKTPVDGPPLRSQGPRISGHQLRESSRRAINFGPPGGGGDKRNRGGASRRARAATAATRQRERGAAKRARGSSGKSGPTVITPQGAIPRGVQVQAQALLAGVAIEAFWRGPYGATKRMRGAQVSRAGFPTGAVGGAPYGLRNLRRVSRYRVRAASLRRLAGLLLGLWGRET